MNIQQIRDIARHLGIKPGKLSKISLVRNIQLAEGNFDCFGKAENQYCDQYGCSWREDCFHVTEKKAELVEET